jgi:predicted transcriptional regulator
MKKLSVKEEVILQLLWAHGDMFIQDLLQYYPDPKPHHNTLATQLGILEDKGYVARKKYANAYRYRAVMCEHDIADKAISDVVDKFYGSSYTQMVSRFVKEEKMDLAELKALIAEIENTK